MKKTKLIIRTTCMVVLVIAGFSLFGYLVKAAVTRLNQSPMEKALDQFVSFPKTIHEVVNHAISNRPPTYAPKQSFQPVNRLGTDLYGISSFIEPDRKSWEIRLFNFRNDQIEHTWKISRQEFYFDETQFENSFPNSGILLPDRTLITACFNSKNIFRLDKNSQVVWHNTQRKFHHAINQGPDGSIWACTEKKNYFIDNVSEKTIQHRTLEGNLYSFLDSGIVKINPESGLIEFEKLVSEILIENGYRNFLFGFSNHTKDKRGADPLHLNDIEPVMKDGPYWRSGDLFLSLRHRSLIIHYRPETNKIIRLIFGPFINQHDVDIVSETEISIFDNNTSGIGLNIPESLKESGGKIQETFNNARIVKFNYSDSNFNFECEKILRQQRVATCYEGSHHRTSKGEWFVESNSDGIMYIFNGDELLYKKQFNSNIDGWVERPTWIRIYENIDF